MYQISVEFVIIRVNQVYYVKKTWTVLKSEIQKGIKVGNHRKYFVYCEPKDPKFANNYCVC